MQSKNRIIMAMSGGVDSSVAAWQLVNEGHDVHGLFMRNWTDDQGYCDAAQDLKDARAVADKLGIPLHVVSFEQAYRDEVFANFLQAYQQGLTPNPDVLCNRHIKFGHLLRYMKRLGGTSLATGHYARIDHSNEGYRLLKGVDDNKDQSYFLHAIHGETLPSIQFPIGHLDKPQLRAIAEKEGLITFDKRDSTGICFIGERPFEQFLAEHLEAKPGPIESLDGETLGQHKGLIFHTLGQRKGLQLGGVASMPEGAWYVVEKRFAENTLVVAQDPNHTKLMSQEICIRDLNWINRQPLNGISLTAKIRHRQADQPCELIAISETKAKIRFANKQRAATAGQYLALYDGAECLGGGLIFDYH